MNIKHADRFLDLRKKHDLSQEELAERIGVSRQAVSKWERAESSPDTDNLIQLARLYNVSLDELLYADEQTDNSGAGDILNMVEDDYINRIRAQDVPDDVHNSQAVESFATVTKTQEPDSTTYASNTAQHGPDTAKYEPAEPRYTSNKAFSELESDIEADIDDLATDFGYGETREQNKAAYESSMYFNRVAPEDPKFNKKALYAFPYPLVTVIVYLLSGFLFKLWHPGWLLILTIPIYYQIVSVITANTTRKKLNRFPFPIMCVFVFLLSGLFLNLWHPMWIIFLLIPIYYIIANSMFQNK